MGRCEISGSERPYMRRRDRCGIPVAAAARLAIGFALCGCLRLPETTTEAVDPAATDEESLRGLVDLANLGICTEDGWSGTIESQSANELSVEIRVVFKGLGSVELGAGATTIDVAPADSADFNVTPATTLDEPALTCNIEIARVKPAELEDQP